MARHNYVEKCPNIWWLNWGRHAMKSAVIKRSIVLAGHRTSVSLEDQFWATLKEIARERDVTLSDLITTIDVHRRHANLSSAIRLFVLSFYRDQFSGHRGKKRMHLVA
jgi:predicted DNA-binding ribbon-helix-helix protein